MFIRSTDPLGGVFNNGQDLWEPSPTAAFAFDLTNPNLFLRHNLANLHALSGKQAAFRAGLQNMATGRSGNLQGNFNRQRTQPQHYQPRANDFDQSMVWFQNVRRLCAVAPSLLCSMSREIVDTDLGISHRWKTPTMHFVDSPAMEITMLFRSSRCRLAKACTMSQFHPRVATIMSILVPAARPTRTPVLVA